jgi:hypothetical protein
VNKIAQISIITASAIVVVALVYYGFSDKPKKLFNKKASEKKKGILLLGGLDYRSGDKNIEQQIDLVKKDIDATTDVKGFRYKDLQGILNAIDENPQYSVMLFSAGCRYADKVAEKMQSVNNSLTNLYILEPYNSGGSTSTAVKKAVNMGVPSKNVFVGKTSSTGVGIVENTSNTPTCSPNHCCSLTEVAKFV